MKYLEEVNKGMALLANHTHTVFVGQAVLYKGTAITHQLKEIPDDKKIEMPVAEDFQAGLCIGLAITGYIPVCIFPRFNFTILACNQIVNHLDKWTSMCDGVPPKVIIKTVVGSVRPLDPGHQHKDNFTGAFKSLCSTIDVIDLQNPEDIYPAYDLALNRTDWRSTILVEYGDYYNEK